MDSSTPTWNLKFLLSYSTISGASMKICDKNTNWRNLEYYLQSWCYMKMKELKKFVSDVKIIFSSEQHLYSMWNALLYVGTVYLGITGRRLEAHYCASVWDVIWL